MSITNKIKLFLNKRKMRSNSIHASRNVFHQSLLYIFSKRNIGVIAKNKKFENSCKGERCFILFTGTSIKNYDLSILKNEKVIASGMAFLHKNFNNCSPFAYFNPGPWEPRSLLHVDFISSCIYKNTSKGCNIFFDVTSQPYIKDVIYSRIEDTFFISNKGNYISSDGIESDLHKPNNIQEGSLSCGLGIAAYMGFKEIYMLGQDFLTDPPVYGHFYDGFHEIGNSEDYQVYRKRALWMIKHLEEKGCKVINVIKDEKHSASFESVTFKDLEAILN